MRDIKLQQRAAKNGAGKTWLVRIEYGWLGLYRLNMLWLGLYGLDMEDLAGTGLYGLNMLYQASGKSRERGKAGG
jgi:hypothetical protein